MTLEEIFLVVMRGHNEKSGCLFASIPMEVIRDFLAKEVIKTWIDEGKAAGLITPPVSPQKQSAQVL